MNDELKVWATGRVTKLLRELHATIGVFPNRDYRAVVKNRRRILLLCLENLSLSNYRKLKTVERDLAFALGLRKGVDVRLAHTSMGAVIDIPKPNQFCDDFVLDEIKGDLISANKNLLVGERVLEEEYEYLSFDKGTSGHVLISGVTRSGKTVLHKLICWNLCSIYQPSTARLIIIDVVKKMSEWGSMQNNAMLGHPIVTDIEEAEAVLVWVLKEMTRRAKVNVKTPKLFIFIDELSGLTTLSDSAVMSLNRIAAGGAGFGIHLIVGTQYPQRSILGEDTAELVRNLSDRFCGKVDNAAAAHIALGLPDTGAEKLTKGGDFLLSNENGLCRIHVPFITNEDLLSLPQTDCVIPIPLSHVRKEESEIEQQVVQDDRELMDHMAFRLCRFLNNEAAGYNAIENQFNIGRAKSKRAIEAAFALTESIDRNGYNISITKKPEYDQPDDAVIYGLYDSHNACHYIGKTTRERLEERLLEHINDAKAGRSGNVEKDEWINRNGDIKIGVLESVNHDRDWSEREMYWIRTGLTKGWPLTNIIGAVGGDK